MSGDSSQSDFFMQVTLDMVVFALINDQLCVFIQKKSSDPFKNCWTLPTTEINTQQDQTLDQAIDRALCSIWPNQSYYSEQVMSLGGMSRDPRGWSMTVIYSVFLPNIPKQSPLDPKSAMWCSIEQLNKQKLAFDHFNVISQSVERLRSKALYTSLPAFLLPDTFTLTELQKAYESVLGFSIEKKSFRRRMLESGILIQTDQMRKANHRPAQIYHLNKKTPHIFNRILEGARTTL